MQFIVVIHSLYYVGVLKIQNCPHNCYRIVLNFLQVLCINVDVLSTHFCKFLKIVMKKNDVLHMQKQRHRSALQ